MYCYKNGFREFCDARLLPWYSQEKISETQKVMKKREYNERCYAGFYHIMESLDQLGDDDDTSPFSDAIDVLTPALSHEQSINPLPSNCRLCDEQIVGICTNCFHYMHRLPPPPNWNLLTVRIHCNCPPGCSSDEEGEEGEEEEEDGSSPPPPPPLPPSILLSFCHYHLHCLSSESTDSHLSTSLSLSPLFAPSRLLVANELREVGGDYLSSYEVAGRDAGFLRRGILKRIGCRGGEDDGNDDGNDGDNDDRDEEAGEWKEWMNVVFVGTLGFDFSLSEESDNEIDETNINVEATAKFMSLYSSCIKEKGCLNSISLFNEFLGKGQKGWMIGKNVWDYGMNRCPSPSTKEKCDDLRQTDCFPPVIYEGLVPGEELKKLSTGLFDKDSDFWKETGYSRDGGSGFFSFWCPLNNSKGGKDNLISRIIEKYLLPAVQRHLDRYADQRKIVGAEWWAHTRKIDAPPLSNLGHRLHFDTDEGSLDEFISDCERKGVAPKDAEDGTVSEFGGVHSPVVSSVLYLDVDDDEDIRGGATVVFDQNVDSEKMANVCWVSRPRDGGFMIFDGGKSKICRESRKKQLGLCYLVLQSTAIFLTYSVHSLLRLTSRRLSLPATAG